MTALLAKWTEELAGGPQAGRSNFPTSKRGEWVDYNTIEEEFKLLTKRKQLNRTFCAPLDVVWVCANRIVKDYLNVLASFVGMIRAPSRIRCYQLKVFLF